MRQILTSGCGRDLQSGLPFAYERTTSGAKNNGYSAAVNPTFTKKMLD
jgi:hypothetical protein